MTNVVARPCDVCGLVKKKKRVLQALRIGEMQTCVASEIAPLRADMVPQEMLVTAMSQVELRAKHHVDSEFQRSIPSISTQATIDDPSYKRHEQLHDSSFPQCPRVRY